MNATAALAFVNAFLTALPGLITASEETIRWIEQQGAVLKAMIAEGRGPSPAEWDALDAAIQELRNRLEGDKAIDYLLGHSTAVPVTTADAVAGAAARSTPPALANEGA